MSPLDLTVEFVDMKRPVFGFSNATVLKAAAMLHYAQALKRIGEEYYAGSIRNALQRTNEMKKELINTRERLGDESFANEISVLEKYIRKMSIESGLDEEETARLIQDRELAPVRDDRDIIDHLYSLFGEIELDLREREAGTIALFGFSFPDNRHSEIIDFLNETAVAYISDLSQYTFIEREKINEILNEKDISYSDLQDTNTAVEVGESLYANYVLTGTVIEMSESVVIFCRVVNIQTAEIESVGQVIVPRNEEVNAML